MLCHVFEPYPGAAGDPPNPCETKLEFNEPTKVVELLGVITYGFGSLIQFTTSQQKINNHIVDARLKETANAREDERDSNVKTIRG